MTGFVSLESLLQQGAMPPRAALEVVVSAGRVVERGEILPVGVISPLTVLVDAEGRVQLCATAGDSAVDVFALAGLLLTLLLGEPPQPDSPQGHAALVLLAERLAEAGGSPALSLIHI